MPAAKRCYFTQLTLFPSGHRHYMKQGRRDTSGWPNIRIFSKKGCVEKTHKRTKNAGIRYAVFIESLYIGCPQLFQTN